MTTKIDLNEIADSVIDLAIENEWCDIEIEDIEWCMGDLYYSVLEIINKKIIIDDDGTIKRIYNEVEK